MAYFLGIDAGDFRLSVAVVKDGLVKAEINVERGIAETISQSIAEVLDQACIDRSALSAIGVSVGPGSFTGVRSSIAASYGLALGFDCELHGVSALLARTAVSTPLSESEVIVATLSANRTENYFQAFLSSQNDLTSAMRGGRLRYKGTSGRHLYEITVAGIATKGSVETIEQQIWRVLGESSQVSVNTRYMPVDSDVLTVSGGASVALSLPGIIAVEDVVKSNRFSMLENVRPLYVKGVNAKTIAERLKEKKV